MTEPASRSCLLAKSSAVVSSLASGIKSDRLRWRRRRRRPHHPLFVSAECSADRGKRSIPVTPLLRWKFDEEGSRGGESQPDPSGETLKKQRKPVGGTRTAVSARRLAAGIWHLRLPKVVGGEETNLDLEINGGQLHSAYVSSGNCFNLHRDTHEDFISVCAIKNHRNGTSHKLEASASLLPSSTERATERNLRNPKVSKDTFDLYDNLKLLEDQKTNKFSIVSALRLELERAWSKIRELEVERQSAKKELDHYVRKVEEKAAWRRREHEKIRSVIDAMKEDLKRERKYVQSLEVMNAKLGNELTEAKLSAKQSLQEFEKERKARELLEEVCHELAKEIGDDKAEVEALKIESVKTREEVEEERKMLQMAEVWREERVQMKLIDAKLALEEKYSELSKLQEEIEAFLSLASSNNYGSCYSKKAKALKEAVGSVIAHDMKEFTYQPPTASDGIFAIFEELQPREQSNLKETKQCHGSVTPEVNGLSENTMKRYDNMMFYGNCDADEDDSGWETASHVEEEDSCRSPKGSEPSVSGVREDSQASVSRANCDNHIDDGKQISEISEVCSAATRDLRKKGSSLFRLWKSTRGSNAEDFKRISFELSSGRLWNGRSFNATLSSARKSAEKGFSSPCVGNWSSPDLMNHHITSGIEGHVEWPQLTKKQSLKAKLMEARIQSQKIQLRQVLKQKI
ncbi:uncharacterized protein LOC110020322 [Phalaenopsis equestris]|uniref:uncharacterized protein LOC110020322 n=1 Tax=Phalaenopsis equestris TaxID=78828 RepID=UPI0009E5E597|nr:uncharacterized protein LOC110020322 [Phalaenopsis equestris]